jgi:hypothetical protein
MPFSIKERPTAGTLDPCVPFLPMLEDNRLSEGKALSGSGRYRPLPPMITKKAGLLKFALKKPQKRVERMSKRFGA